MIFQDNNIFCELDEAISVNLRVFLIVLEVSC